GGWGGWAVEVSGGLPSERVVVPSKASSVPFSAVGWPAARRGGQAAAQPPVQELVVPLSFSNRYRVRPWESTRIWPRSLLARPTMAGRPVLLCGTAAERLAVPWPLPQAAPTSTTNVTVTALALENQMLDWRRSMIVPFLSDANGSTHNSRTTWKSSSPG